MPIVNINESKQLEFGHGDIEVAPALLQTDEVVGAVCFFQRETVNTIGEHTDYEPNKTVDVEDTPVRMIFDKVESIDVVIWALQKAKEMMLEKSNPELREETWYSFAGDDNCEDCRGWDGIEYRCDCGNRRVYWDCEKRTCECKTVDQKAECQHCFANAD
jgi:hypothetical protein